MRACADSDRGKPRQTGRGQLGRQATDQLRAAAGTGQARDRRGRVRGQPRMEGLPDGGQFKCFAGVDREVDTQG